MGPSFTVAGIFTPGTGCGEKLKHRTAADGILACASDPTAPTEAYAAEKPGLSESPYVSVDILREKDKYREFLSKNGLRAPAASGYNSVGNAPADKKRENVKLAGN